MRPRLYTLGFYISAAAIALLQVLDWQNSNIICSALIFVHLSAQTMNLYMNEQIAKKRVVVIIFGIAAVLILISLNWFIDFLFLARYYLILLVIIKGYLHNTAIYPAKYRRLIYLVIGSLICSTLFRITHWAGADVLFNGAYLFLAILLAHIGLFKAKAQFKVFDEIDEIGKE